MEFLTSQQMREIDNFTVEEIGISERKLMEIAGLRTAEFIRERFEPQRVRVFAGKGNNGGDAIVAARRLDEYGFKPVVSVIEEPKGIPGEELQIIQNLGVQRTGFETYIDSDLILDGIFGYSISGDPRPPYNRVIQRINSSDAKTVSLDVPSGLNPQKGDKQDPSVESDYVLTLAAPKQGLEVLDSEVHLVDIGIPGKAFRENGFEKPEGFRKKDILELEV